MYGKINVCEIHRDWKNVKPINGIEHVFKICGFQDGRAIAYHIRGLVFWKHLRKLCHDQC